MKKVCIAAVCLMLLATGCTAPEDTAVDTKVYIEEPVRHVASAVSEVTVEQILNEYNSARKTVEVQAEEDGDEGNDSLPVVGCACQVGDNYILFPKVNCAAEEAINSAICAAVAQRAENLGIPVFADYRVEYNRHGIFSIRMFLYDLYGDSDVCIDCVPLTFNSETGELYRISDFFDSENQNWRGRIPDIITAQAADCQMVLLSDILPIEDDRPFYITDEAVVIMYDLYEIATYAAGEPEFEIPVDDIAECLDEASLLNAMLPQDVPQEPEAVESEPEEPLEHLPEQPQDTAEHPEQNQDAEEQPEYAPDTENAGETQEQPEETTEQTQQEPAVISDEEELPEGEEA